MSHRRAGGDLEESPASMASWATSTRFAAQIPVSPLAHGDSALRRYTP